MELNEIHKKGYLISYKNVTIEADEFFDSLEGLLIAEMEFKNKSEAQNFNPPSWFSAEVTNRNEFKNKNLVGKHYSDIKSLMDE